MALRPSLRRFHWSSPAVFQLVLGPLPWVPTFGPIRSAQINVDWVNQTGPRGPRCGGADGSGGRRDQRPRAVLPSRPQEGAENARLAIRPSRVRSLVDALRWISTRRRCGPGSTPCRPRCTVTRT
jgi:hypothetical protein